MDYSLLEEWVNVDKTFSKEQLKHLFGFCEIKKYKKGELIKGFDLNEHQIYFVNSGALVVNVMVMDGKKKVFSFNFKKSIVCDYADFFQNPMPSLEIVALVESELVLVPFRAISYGFYHFVGSNLLAARFLQRSLGKSTQELINRKYLSAEELYLDLEKKFPEINMVAPQTLIASYLDITPVHLSRIKKKLYSLSKNVM